MKNKDKKPKTGDDLKVSEQVDSKMPLKPQDDVLNNSSANNEKITKDITKKLVKNTKQKLDNKSNQRKKEREIRRADSVKIKEIKQINRQLNAKKKRLARRHGKEVLQGKIFSLTESQPNVSENIIELYDVHKWYYSGSVALEAIKGLNLKIRKGSFVCILGPSGSGKTTLLNIMSGLDTCEKGDVFVNGFNLSVLNDRLLTKFRRENVAFIFQQYNLLSNLTALENAEIGANLSQKKMSQKDLENIFATIGLKNEIHKFPFQLSGGQQQRVSIARALAKNPQILFCDEPTGALDEQTGKNVLDVIIKTNQLFNMTVVFVTHNPNITQLADYIIHFKNGQLSSFEHNPHKAQDSSKVAWA